MLRVISWNIGQRPICWRGLSDGSLTLGADVALLQEARRPPPDLNMGGEFCDPLWTTFRTAITRLSDRIELVPRPTVPLGSYNGGDDMPVSRPGSLALAEVRLPETGERIVLVSMYASWECWKDPSSGRRSWLFGDGSAHRLISDLSWLVRGPPGATRPSEHKLIVAGDLNIYRGYGDRGSAYWKQRYQTVFDRMDAIGLHFVGPRLPNGHPPTKRPAELPPDHDGVPTYRTRQSDATSATHQLDFVFASRSLVPRTAVRAINGADEWGPSDHCRLIIELAAR